MGGYSGLAGQKELEPTADRYLLPFILLIVMLSVLPALLHAAVPRLRRWSSALSGGPVAPAEVEAEAADE